VACRHGDERLSPNFWRQCQVDEVTGCWIWTGSLNHNGYGKTWRRGKHWRSHRLAYVALVGEIADGLQIDHLCRRPACVNPDHLEPVTPRENTLRGDGKTAINARKTQCPQGHALTPDNVMLDKKNHRSCATCHREQSRRWRAKERAARIAHHATEHGEV
jgi:hypothetical protein